MACFLISWSFGETGQEKKQKTKNRLWFIFSPLSANERENGMNGVVDKWERLLKAPLPHFPRGEIGLHSSRETWKPALLNGFQSETPPATRHRQSQPHQTHLETRWEDAGSVGGGGRHTILLTLFLRGILHHYPKSLLHWFCRIGTFCSTLYKFFFKLVWAKYNR